MQKVGLKSLLLLFLAPMVLMYILHLIVPWRIFILAPVIRHRHNLMGIFFLTVVIGVLVLPINFLLLFWER